MEHFVSEFQGPQGSNWYRCTTGAPTPGQEYKTIRILNRTQIGPAPRSGSSPDTQKSVTKSYSSRSRASSYVSTLPPYDSPPPPKSPPKSPKRKSPQRGRAAASRAGSRRQSLVSLARASQAAAAKPSLTKPATQAAATQAAAPATHPSAAAATQLQSALATIVAAARRGTRPPRSGARVAAPRSPFQIVRRDSPEVNKQDTRCNKKINKNTIQTKFNWPLPKIDDTSPFHMQKNDKTTTHAKGTSADADNYCIPKYIVHDSRPWIYIDSDGNLIRDNYEIIESKRIVFTGLQEPSYQAPKATEFAYRTVSNIRYKGHKYYNVLRQRVTSSWSNTTTNGIAYDALDDRTSLTVRVSPIKPGDDDYFRIIVTKIKPSLLDPDYTLSFGPRTDLKKPFIERFAKSSPCLVLKFQKDRGLHIDYLQINPVYEVADYYSPLPPGAPAGAPRAKTEANTIKMNPLYKNYHCAVPVDSKSSGPCVSQDLNDTEKRKVDKYFNAKTWCNLAQTMAVHFNCAYIWLHDFMRTSWIRTGPNSIAEGPYFQFLCQSRYGIGYDGYTKYEKYMNMKPMSHYDFDTKKMDHMNQLAYDFFTKEYLKDKTFKNIGAEYQDHIKKLCRECGIVVATATWPDKPIQGPNGVTELIYKCYEKQADSPKRFYEYLSTIPKLFDEAREEAKLDQFGSKAVNAGSLFMWKCIKSEREPDILNSKQKRSLQALIDTWHLKEADKRKTGHELTVETCIHEWRSFDPYKRRYATNRVEPNIFVGITQWKNCEDVIE